MGYTAGHMVQDQIIERVWDGVEEFFDGDDDTR